jgi:hypothetical protein
VFASRDGGRRLDHRGEIGGQPAALVGEGPNELNVALHDGTIKQALSRLEERDAGRDEDREHDGEAGELLAAYRAEEEGDPERYRGERITDVVDQVGEERDRAGEDEDAGLD